MAIDENDAAEAFSSLLYVRENIFPIFQSLITLEIDQSSYEIPLRLSFDDNRLDHFRSSTHLLMNDLR